jgi:hypothetical protein
MDRTRHWLLPVYCHISIELGKENEPTLFEKWVAYAINEPCYYYVKVTMFKRFKV